MGLGLLKYSFACISPQESSVPAFPSFWSRGPLVEVTVPGCQAAGRGLENGRNDNGLLILQYSVHGS